jgi:hypothetical protein
MRRRRAFWILASGQWRTRIDEDEEGRRRRDAGRTSHDTTARKCAPGRETRSRRPHAGHGPTTGRTHGRGNQQPRANNQQQTTMHNNIPHLVIQHVSARASRAARSCAKNHRGNAPSIFRPFQPDERLSASYALRLAPPSRMEAQPRAPRRAPRP